MRPAPEWKPEPRSRAIARPDTRRNLGLKTFSSPALEPGSTSGEDYYGAVGFGLVPGGGALTVDPGVVYIGKKPTMNYVLAVVTYFNGGSREVVVKARGRSISRAVDVAEIVRGRFIPDAEVRDVRIATEKVTAEDGRATNVSAIEIVLSK